MQVAQQKPQSIDYDGNMLATADSNGVVAGGSPFAYSLSLDDVEAWLSDDE